MNLKKLLGTLMPVASTVIGTVHPVAGMALNAVAAALGVDQKAPRDQVEALIASRIQTATPDQLAALRAADQQFELSIQQLGLDRERLAVEVDRLEVDDRKDARVMGKTSGQQAQITLTLILTVMVAVVTWQLGHMLMSEAAPNREVLALLSMILGVLLREWAGAMHYWFGTTLGSSRKNDWKAGA